MEPSFKNIELGSKINELVRQKIEPGLKKRERVHQTHKPVPWQNEPVRPKTPKERGRPGRGWVSNLNTRASSRSPSRDVADLPSERGLFPIRSAGKTGTTAWFLKRVFGEAERSELGQLALRPNQSRE